MKAFSKEEKKTSFHLDLQIHSSKQDTKCSLDRDTCNSLIFCSVFIIISCFLLSVHVWGAYVPVCMRESGTEPDKERESLCKEFGKLNKVPQESLPKDLGECSRFWRERPLKSENTLALSY